MGQTGSSERSGINLDAIQGEVYRHASIIKEVALLSYDEFINDINEINKICHTFKDVNNKRLVFAIKKGTDASLLWKATVRIGCVKVESETDKIESYRLLNLKQFLHVRKTILCQASTSATCLQSPEPMMPIPSELLGGESSAQSDLTTSMLLDGVDCHYEQLDECCICMERKPEVILPCAHNYCLPCIEQWNISNKTCPICRETVESTDDNWVISEVPDSAEVAAEIQKCLSGFAEQAGTLP